MKRLISLMMAVCFLFGAIVFGGGRVFAQEAENVDDFSGRTVNVEIDYTNAQHNEDGTTYYDILNVEEMAEAWGIEPDKVREMKFVALPAQEDAADAYGASPAGLFSRIEIQNVTALGNLCLNRIVAQEIAQNMSSQTITKEIEISASVSHTYTTNVEAGIDVEVSSISSAVGFDVTTTLTITDRTIVELEPGEAVEVIAVPSCNSYQFEVYQWKLFSGTSYVGSGYAHQVVGFCITVYDV